MELIKGLPGLKQKFGETVITIGNFDGVHLGHQELISKVVKDADNSGMTSVVLTFERHTRGLAEGLIISSLTQKVEKIRKLGVDVLLVVKFDNSFAMLKPDEFVCDILCSKLGVKKIILGPDFRFGKDRSGNIEFLEKMGNKFGFCVEVLPFIHIRGIKISSSEIRLRLKEKEYQAVSLMLGEQIGINNQPVV